MYKYSVQPWQITVWRLKVTWWPDVIKHLWTDDQLVWAAPANPLLTVLYLYWSSSTMPLFDTKVCPELHKTPTMENILQSPHWKRENVVCHLSCVKTLCNLVPESKYFISSLFYLKNVWVKVSQQFPILHPTTSSFLLAQVPLEPRMEWFPFLQDVLHTSF